MKLIIPGPSEEDKTIIYDAISDAIKNLKNAKLISMNIEHSGKWQFKVKVTFQEIFLLSQKKPKERSKKTQKV